MEALRRADFLADQMRAQMQAAAVPASQPRARSSRAPSARSWFAGRSVGVILLVLGALCVLAAGAVFVAVEWMQLALAVRTLILVVVTASFGFLSYLALRRGLQATAEAMAVVTTGMFVLDLPAARGAGLLGLGGLTAAPFAILVGVLLVAVAGAGALVVRSGGRRLWTADAAVACGMAGAAAGVLGLDSYGYGLSAVTVTLFASLLFLGWRRLRLPVAMWSAVALGAVAWFAAVATGAGRAVDYVGPAHPGDDLGLLACAWPALAVALVAGLWSVRLTQSVWRRVAASMCVLPVLLVFEIVGWSHGWVVGTSVMLVGYVIAALLSGRVPVAWSSAVGASALVLALSSVAGVLPTTLALGARLGLALDLPTRDVAPWLLPVTVLVVLVVLPTVTIGRYRFSVDQHHTAGAFVTSLAVMPVLYGASFWVSITVLVVVALALICGARLWRSDVLLLLGLLLLAMVRIFAYHDDLADPLAWTLIAAACLALALTESRLVVWAGFAVAAGLFALLGAAGWLTFVQVPRPYQALVIVVIGSVGLLASQRLPDGPLTSRVVGEGVSVTWIVAGLAMAGSSPSHRALELTVAGVATGITAYLSQDRRGAGWVSGILLTIASWVRLADNDTQAIEWYTLPAATALLVYGVRRLRRDATESSWRCLGPGLTLALTPSLFLALDEPVSWRGLVVGLASVAMVALGVRVSLAAPFALGVVATGLLALRNIWPVAAFIPRWTLLFLVGGVLLATGVTWESRVRDVRTAGRYVKGLR